ncbi:MAG: NAD-dependent epimerase/dehydratase family protein [Ruminiclostridium sp.]|nr:NAD-dependent epimerase/dehydratase family protein [Ruminiclostridium sp.]
MNVLVLGGTRYFGIHMVKALFNRGHDITIATRGLTKDEFGKKVRRVVINRTDPNSITEAFHGKHYDVVCDNLAYCSNDVKSLLDNVKCDRYIMTSSASVYSNIHMDIKENEYDARNYPLQWCNRQDYPYDEVKRQAECALFQCYTNVESVAVRLPYVIGEDDYTKRLYFYVEEMIKGSTLSINNLDEKIAFISSCEAGKFIAWLAEQHLTGPINGSNSGVISLHEVIGYVQQKTGMAAKLSEEGLNGSFNDQKSFSLDNAYANAKGYHFPDLKPWVWGLLDNYIDKAKNNMRI